MSIFDQKGRRYLKSWEYNEHWVEHEKFDRPIAQMLNDFDALSEKLWPRPVNTTTAGQRRHRAAKKARQARSNGSPSFVASMAEEVSRSEATRTAGTNKVRKKDVETRKQQGGSATVCSGRSTTIDVPWRSA